MGVVEEDIDKSRKTLSHLLGRKLYFQDDPENFDISQIQPGIIPESGEKPTSENLAVLENLLKQQGISVPVTESENTLKALFEKAAGQRGLAKTKIMDLFNAKLSSGGEGSINPAVLEKMKKTTPWSDYIPFVNPGPKYEPTEQFITEQVKAQNTVPVRDFTDLTRDEFVNGVHNHFARIDASLGKKDGDDVFYSKMQPEEFKIYQEYQKYVDLVNKLPGSLIKENQPNKPIDQASFTKFLKAFGGDANKALKVARQRGFIVDNLAQPQTTETKAPVQPTPIKFSSPEDVKKAVINGLINKDDAIEILKAQFGAED